MEVPVSPVGIRGVEIFDKVIAFAEEEVICQHDSDQAAHEDSHSCDAGEEYGTGNQDFPWDHAPPADDATDHLAADDVNVSRS